MPLARILREQILQVHLARGQSLVSDSGMKKVYDYLTSSLFKLRIETMGKVLQGLTTSLNKEKKTIANIWKNREQEIETLVQQTHELTSEIKDQIHPGFSSADFLISGAAPDNAPDLPIPPSSAPKKIGKSRE